MESRKAGFHLPGLFEFYEFYEVFLPLYAAHREYFYDWAEIASLYGAPQDAIWGGGRCGQGDADVSDVLQLLRTYGISGRLTFSNSLLREEHLGDRRCNRLCKRFAEESGKNHGVIVHSDLLLHYLEHEYPELYMVSSTTKVITDFTEFTKELRKEDFRYVVPDFRLNKRYEDLQQLPQTEKDKVEFLCNECCDAGCRNRKVCYENVSRRVLGEDCPEHTCSAPQAQEGYRFSRAMQNPMFIGLEDIQNWYLPHGYTNFKIEGRGLGSAVLLEFILYYMVKPEYQLMVREEIYLDSMLHLF